MQLCNRKVLFGAVMSGICTPCTAVADSTGESEPQSAGHHRLDLSYSRIETFEGEADLLLTGYTLTLSAGFRVGVTLSYLALDPDVALAELGVEKASGWGDTQLVLQWDPGEAITSNPWVPDQLGLYSIITAPTANSRLTADLWDVEVGFGVPVYTTTQFAFLPSAYIRTTFEESDPDTTDREIGLVPGLYWVVNDQFWLGYAPAIAYNTTFDEWRYDHSLTAGWLFRSGIGLGFSIARTDRVDRSAQSDVFTGLLNVYFVFGQSHK